MLPSAPAGVRVSVEVMLVRGVRLRVGRRATTLPRSAAREESRVFSTRFARATRAQSPRSSERPAQRRNICPDTSLICRPGEYAVAPARSADCIVSVQVRGNELGQKQVLPLFHSDKPLSSFVAFAARGVVPQSVPSRPWGMERYRRSCRSSSSRAVVATWWSALARRAACRSTSTRASCARPTVDTSTPSARRSVASAALCPIPCAAASRSGAHGCRIPMDGRRNGGVRLLARNAHGARPEVSS